MTNVTEFRAYVPKPLPGRLKTGEVSVDGVVPVVTWEDAPFQLYPPGPETEGFMSWVWKLLALVPVT